MTRDELMAMRHRVDAALQMALDAGVFDVHSANMRLVLETQLALIDHELAKMEEPAK
jgi:hypothetical protein